MILYIISKEISKNIQLLKDKMRHFFIENPEFEKNIQLADQEAI